MNEHKEQHMSEKVESGLEVVCYLRAFKDGTPNWSEDAVSDFPVFPLYSEDQTYSMPLVRQSDAERALSERDAEIQRQREGRRTTWTQLEQVTGLLREISDHPQTELHKKMRARLLSALSQQVEPVAPFDLNEFARRAGQMMAEHSFHGFEPIAMAIAEELIGVQTEPAPAQDESLADRMRAAGMMTVDEMLRGAPLDGFMRHAGVHDLDSYGQWLDMKCREFLSMQASRDLDKREDDDLYEWVLAHAAAFQEARINFNAARPAQTEQQPTYQIRVRGNREWSDVHAEGYRISLENPTLQTRIVYAALSATPNPAMDAKEE